MIIELMTKYPLAVDHFFAVLRAKEHVENSEEENMDGWEEFLADAIWRKDRLF